MPRQTPPQALRLRFHVAPCQMLCDTASRTDQAHTSRLDFCVCVVSLQDKLALVQTLGPTPLRPLTTHSFTTPSAAHYPPPLILLLYTDGHSTSAPYTQRLFFATPQYTTFLHVSFFFLHNPYFGSLHELINIRPQRKRKKYKKKNTNNRL